MKSILIGGYYGANNTGDEALLCALLNTFRDLRNGLEFTIVSHTPELTKSQHGVQAVYWRDIPALAQAVHQADLVLIGGGGLFMDYWGLDEDSYFRSIHGGISTYGTLAWLADAFGIPWMLCGVGVGPLFSEAAREHTWRLFSQAPLATLRDDGSLSLLQEIGLNPLPNHIHLTTDSAFSLKVSPRYRQKAHERCVQFGLDSDTPLLGLSLRYWDRPQAPVDWLPQLTEGLREFLLNTSVKILLLPFQIGEDILTNDLKICRTLQKEIDLPGSVHIVEELPSPFEIQALLGCCDLILGMRLHALLMGINEGVPVVGLAYDPKVLEFMKRGGMEEWVCSMPFEHQTLSDLLQEAWKDRKELALQALKYRQNMLPLARKNAELAIHLLDTYPREHSPELLINFLIDRLAQMQYMDEQVQPLIQSLNDQIQSLESELNDVQSRATLAQQRLNDIETSQTFRLAVVFQNIRNRILPQGSRRETWLYTLLKRPKDYHKMK